MYWDYTDILLHTEETERERERLKRTWFEAKQKSGRHKRERHETESERFPSFFLDCRQSIINSLNSNQI